MKTMARKALRAFILLAAALLAALALYVAYLFLSYSRLPDMLPLAAENNPSAVAQTGTEYTLLSFNIGFGAYEPDFGFFMDGGKESRAFSKERLLANLANIEAFLQAQDADFLLIQETDEDGTRTYHVNEREALTNALDGYASVWAQNWDSAYLFYPFHEPHGKNVAGLMTFSRFGVSSALRRSLPIETNYMKLLDLDRCYSVSRIPLESGAELVLYNVHLSAYTSDGTIADEQLDLLIADMAAEYAAAISTKTCWATAPRFSVPWTAAIRGRSPCRARSSPEPALRSSRPSAKRSPSPPAATQTARITRSNTS